ncbi:MAG: preprotein translocase subunit SecG [Amaricoccus sp.]|uniref:preprotein translocase subunit SecG n=1 Tax=Amaricoccus sp. TaxID=1872485 RepID=UPI0039E3FD10
MQAVVLSIHLILALALIIVVLLQRSEGGALGMGGGGVMTSRGAATALSKLTWMIGAAFVVTSLALTIIAARDSRSNSVIDGMDTSAPAATPAVPDLGTDLLPKVPGATDDGPATPPAPDAPATQAPAAQAPASDAPATETPTPAPATTAPAATAPATPPAGDAPATPPPAQ